MSHSSSDKQEDHFINGKDDRDDDVLSVVDGTSRRDRDSTAASPRRTRSSSSNAKSSKIKSNSKSIARSSKHKRSRSVSRATMPFHQEQEEDSSTYSADVTKTVTTASTATSTATPTAATANVTVTTTAAVKSTTQTKATTAVVFMKETFSTSLRRTTRHRKSCHHHGASNNRHDDSSTQNKSFIQIRSMTMKDLSPVYHLGNSIFTASEFPNMYRTWDEFTVIENYEGSREFCFVAEEQQQQQEELPKQRTNKKRKNTATTPPPATLDDTAILSSTASTTPSVIVGFLLGHAMTQKVGVETRGYIQWVAVHPDYRRAGLATQLLHQFTAAGRSQQISRLLADTPADNIPAIRMFEKAGLNTKTDHVYLTRQLLKDSTVNTNTTRRVDDDGEINFTYSIKRRESPHDKISITIRNMELDDLHPIYRLGETIFTAKSANLYNFWDESLVLQSYLSDPEFCVVATTTIETKKKHDHSGTTRSNHHHDNDDTQYQEEELVIGFAFGTTIEKPRSSWKYGYLVWLGCSPAYQGMGLASQLYHVMQELFALEKVRMLMIDTQQNNQGALAFFRKMGFGHEEKHVYLCNNAAENKGKGNKK